MTTTKIDPEEFPPSIYHLLPFIEERFLNGTEQEFYSMERNGNYRHIIPEQLAQHSYELFDVIINPPRGAPAVTYSATLRNTDNDYYETIAGVFTERCWLRAFGCRNLGIQTLEGVEFNGIAIDFSREQWEEHSKIVGIGNVIPVNGIEEYMGLISQQFQKGKKIDLPIGVLI